MTVLPFSEAGRADRLFATVTPAERLILRPLMGGQLNKEIAHYVGVSESTVKGAIADMLHAGHFANRVQLARWALLNPNVYRDDEHGRPYLVEIYLHGPGCQCEESRCVTMRQIDTEALDEEKAA